MFKKLLSKGLNISINKGMTLIEVLVSLVITSIILGSMYTILLQALNNWEIADTRAEIAQNARIAMGRMTKELRHAVAIDTITSDPDDGITFWVDNDFDGVDDLVLDPTDYDGNVDTGETITYGLSWDATKDSYSLIRTVSGSTGEEFANYIQDNVNDFQLTYWKDDGSGGLTPVVEGGDEPETKLIKIKLSIKKDLFDEEYAVHLIGSAHLRNMN